MANKRIEIKIGSKIGKWTVIGEGKTVGPCGHRKMLCECECGILREVLSYVLKRNGSKSCGCLANKIASKRLLKHGYARHRMYPSWNVMMQRCYNPKNKSYKIYGGRGIKVCKRWHSFENFLKDMGERPKSLTIERKDNNGNYTPENCIWATRKRQANNTRNNTIYTINGKSKTLAQWADEIGVNHSTIIGRIKRGWPIEKAVSIPALKKWSRHNVNF